MRKLIITLILTSSVLISFNSCSGCVKKTSKKVTELGLDAVEGVSEAIDERGDKIGEKVTDAAGSLAEGVGKSLDRQLNEHAEKVASVVGRTLVQSVDGLDKGLTKEYYDSIPYTPQFTSGVSLDFFGKIKTKSVIDAYFIILEKGTYNCKFEFRGANNQVFLTRDTEIIKTEADRKYSLVSFAISPQEEESFKQLKDVKITVSKKK